MCIQLGQDFLHERRGFMRRRWLRVQRNLIDVHPLLPVELVLNVGSGAGFAMVFALLISAIVWNLGSWYLGLPVSSSNTLIGSIMGVGLANSLVSGHVFGEGVNWAKVLRYSAL